MNLTRKQDKIYLFESLALRDRRLAMIAATIGRDKQQNTQIEADIMMAKDDNATTDANLFIRFI